MKILKDCFFVILILLLFTAKIPFQRILSWIKCWYRSKFELQSCYYVHLRTTPSSSSSGHQLGFPWPSLATRLYPPSLPVVFKATSCIGTELLYAGSSWSSWLCSSRWRGPPENVVSLLFVHSKNSIPTNPFLIFHNKIFIRVPKTIPGGVLGV